MSVSETTPEKVVAAAATSLSIRTTRGRMTVLGFSLAHFSHHVTNSLLNPLLPLIRDTFALSYAESGIAVSAYSLSLGLANAPMGVLADRVGPRLVLAGGLVLVGAASVALALVGAYWQLLAVLVAMGVISGTYHAPAASLLARAFPERGRGAAMGLHITGGHFSFFAVPLVAGSLAAATGTWRTPYLWFAAAPILSGLLNLLYRTGIEDAHCGMRAFTRAAYERLRRDADIVIPLYDPEVLKRFPGGKVA